MIENATKESVHAIAERAIAAGTCVQRLDLRVCQQGQLVVVRTNTGLCYVIEVVRPANPTARIALCEDPEDHMDFAKGGERSMTAVLTVGYPISYGSAGDPDYKIDHGTQEGGVMPRLDSEAATGGLHLC
jgi:hypothetical protein